jgi:hypothetical protein
MQERGVAYHHQTNSLSIWSLLLRNQIQLDLANLSVLGWRDTIEKLGVGHVESAGANKLVKVEMTHPKQVYSQVSADVL